MNFCDNLLFIFLFLLFISYWFFNKKASETQGGAKSFNFSNHSLDHPGEIE
jgi:hypothetical protein